MKANKINDEHGPKVRADSWAAKLTPDQQWQLYRRAKQSCDWMDAVDWAKEEFHLDKSPGRSAFYSWMAAMQKLECEDRLRKIGFAVAQANALGKKMPNDELIFATFKTLAFEAGLAGNVKAANTYTQIACTIQKLQYKKLEFEHAEADRLLNEAAQRTACDAGRRSLLLSWVQKSGKSIPETVEDRKNFHAYIKKYTDELFGPYDYRDANGVLKTTFNEPLQSQLPRSIKIPTRKSSA